MGRPIAEKFILSRDSQFLLCLDFGFAISVSLSGIFLSIYLWRLTESWMVNGLYHISLFFFVVVGFVMGGWMSKKKDRILTFCLGILMMACFFLGLIIFQERVAVYPVFFGMLNGLAQGFYWIAMLVITYDLTTNDNRLRYFGWQAGVMTFAGILGPLVSGFVIGWFPGLGGYIVVFTMSFILFVFIIVGSFFIKQETFRSQTFYLSFIFQRSLKRCIWKKHFFGWFTIGLREGIILFLPPVLLFHIVEEESIVGLLAVGFGIVKIASSQVLGCFGKKEHYHYHILAAAVGLVLTTLILMIEVNLATVLIFMVGNAFFSPAIRMSYTSHMYRLMSGLPSNGKKLKTELIATRQIFLTLGRIFTVALFMMVVNGMDYLLMVWILVLATCAQFLLYFVMVQRNRLSKASVSTET